MLESFNAKLNARREKNQFRTRNVQDLKNTLNFTSSDYLGLSQHPKVIADYQNALLHYGAGSSASQLISGYTQAHAELENALAQFMQSERALLFSSGYLTNLALFSSLCDAGDLVLADRYSHISLLDGILLSGARLQRYPHCDLNALEDALKKSSHKNKFIVTDGVFSMEGNCAPLYHLKNLADQYNAFLIIDDTHGLGVLGENGRGAIEQDNVKLEDNVIITSSLAKGFGTSGGFIAANDTIIENIIQFGKSYGYTSGFSPAIAAATLTSLKIIQNEPERRVNLKNNIALFQSHTENTKWLSSDTPIQIFITDSEETTLKYQAILKEKGILVGAIRPPTVPENQCRLRVGLTLQHNEHEIKTLVNAIQ